MTTDRIANPLRAAGFPGSRATDAAPGPLMRLWAKAVDAVERRRALRHIAEMDDRMLRDVGIQRGNAGHVVAHGREDDKRVTTWWVR